MNFLNFLTSGASLFNFNLQNLGINAEASTIHSQKTLNTEVLKSNITQKQQINEKEDLSNANIEEICPPNKVELFTQQQQLINQYMHLNIQLLSKKLQTLEHTQKAPVQAEELIDVKSNKKKIKKSNACGHADKQHYAKGMCNNCYHKFGRTKKPWNCPHKKLYANGMCQNCYINKYNKKRREEKTEENPQSQTELKIEESEYQIMEKEQDNEQKNQKLNQKQYQ